MVQNYQGGVYFSLGNKHFRVSDYKKKNSLAGDFPLTMKDILDSNLQARLVVVILADESLRPKVWLVLQVPF